MKIEDRFTEKIPSPMINEYHPKKSMNKLIVPILNSRLVKIRGNHEKYKERVFAAFDMEKSSSPSAFSSSVLE